LQPCWSGAFSCGLFEGRPPGQPEFPQQVFEFGLFTPKPLSGESRASSAALRTVGMQSFFGLGKLLMHRFQQLRQVSVTGGIDLRQPEVSLAIKYMAGQGWVKSDEIPSAKKGRPNKKYSLAIPVKEIMAAIEKNTRDEANQQLALVKKMKNYI